MWMSVALLRCKTNITIDDNHGNRPTKKAEPRWRLCRVPPHRRVCIFAACSVEALPYSVPLDLAGGTGDASVDEVCEGHYRQCGSNHRAPSYRLTGHIDPRVTSQMRIFVVALEVSLAGINMSFTSVVGVVLCFIIGHGITSLVLLLYVFRLSYSESTA
jgi:hypothetical protein